MERKASVKAMKRTSTWIEKGGITLRGVLKDPKALKAFQDYACSVHSEENITFWIAVEFFRAQHMSTPKTSRAMRKRFSTALNMGEDLSLSHEFEFTSENRKVLEKELVLAFDDLNLMEMPENQLMLLNEAYRIYKTFMEEGSKHWTSLDDTTCEHVRTRIMKGDVDINIFSEAQRKVYHVMLMDLFPRFLKAVQNDPLTFSTQDRFELPEGTIKNLNDEEVHL